MASSEFDKSKEIAPLPIATFGVVLLRQNEVLLVRHSERAAHRTGIYGIPAGIPEAGETGKKTAARECFEETGIVISPEVIIEYPNNFAVADILRKEGVKKFSITAYLYTQAPSNIKLTETEQAIPEWVPIDQLTQLDERGLLLPNMQFIFIIENGVKFYRNKL